MVYVILMESIVLVGLVYIVFLMFFYKSMGILEMISSYECGFDSSCSSRLVFSYRFFLISILFIIFDVEISLMVSVPFFMLSEMSMYFFFFFIMILLVGLMYEYYYGSLDWLHYCIN